MLFFYIKVTLSKKEGKKKEKGESGNGGWEVNDGKKDGMMAGRWTTDGWTDKLVNLEMK